MASRLFSKRQILSYAAVVFLLYLADPLVPTFVIGLALALVGIGIRIWGCGHLRKNKNLTTSGPYAHVKHPLYLGTFLISVGAILAAGAPQMPGVLIWVVFGPVFLLAFFLYYLPKKKRIEGGRLARGFPGEFDEWDKSVPAFLPSLKAYPSAASDRWSWRTYWGNNELPMDLLILVLFCMVSLASTLLPWR